MGCAQSRVDNEEAVTRCKERRQWMKRAVEARNAFASEHSAYAVSIKNTGAALSEFGQGEAHELPPPSGTAFSSSTGPAGGQPSSIGPSGVQPPSMDTLPPPPPPLPEFSPLPIQRSISMPDLPKKFVPPRNLQDDSIREEDEDGDDEATEEAEEAAEELRHRRRNRRPQPAADSPSPSPSPAPVPVTPPPPMPESNGLHTWDYFFVVDENMAGPSLSQGDEIRPESEQGSEARYDRSAPPPPPPPPPAAMEAEEEPATPQKVVMETPPPKPSRKQKNASAVHHQHAASESAMDQKTGKLVPAAPRKINLLQVLADLDDHFLKASESTHEVSKMLEATRMHYHSNFADNRGHIDHSARVMRVITWNRSFKGIPNADKDDFDDDEWETHATVLDKMLAWEKKLYDEVKAGELMKIEYQRKVALLNKQKKRGASTEALERTKAAVSHLHTRYIVDMQSMDSTVSEIQRLRDKQLYPRLVDLVDGMAKMWQAMCFHHESQLRLVLELKALDISNAPKDTSEHHYKRTLQLADIVKGWHDHFEKLVNYQKEYVHNLNSWLRLNLVPIESSLKEKVSSPPRPAHAPIQTLLLAWNEHLGRLPDEIAKNAILSFLAVINTIVALQQDELKQKDKCTELSKEYLRKNHAFEEWFQKYSHRKAGLTEEAEAAEGAEGGEGATSNQNDPVSEKKFIVDTLKNRLDEELENHRQLCKQVREKSLTSLKTHLPELFRAILDFAQACSDMYTKLNLVSNAESAD